MRFSDQGLNPHVEIRIGRRAGRVASVRHAFVRRCGTALLLGVVGLSATVHAAGEEPDAASKAEAPKMVLEPRGSLVIVGGGGMPDSIRKKFVDLGGGAARAKVVVIPTASEGAEGDAAALDEYLEPWRKQGVASVTLVHTRSRDKANAPEFARPIDEATAVWFSGGDQSMITDAYLGTQAEQAFRRVLERGGVIGGTSAGAAIMSRVMITGGHDKATVGVGLGYLPGAVVDQHALRRSRVNRMMGVVADHPGLIGVAVDESTALVVQPEEWHVLGKSYVVFFRPASAGSPQRIDFFKEGDRGKFGDWKSPASNADGDR